MTALSQILRRLRMRKPGPPPTPEPRPVRFEWGGYDLLKAVEDAEDETARELGKMK